MLEGMRRMGATPAQLAEARAEMLHTAQAEADAAPKPFEVWEENWPTFEAFSSLRSQWLFSDGLNGRRREGFNYAGVQAYLELCVRRRRRRQVFEELQLMEAEVLKSDDEWRAARAAERR